MDRTESLVRLRRLLGSKGRGLIPLEMGKCGTVGTIPCVPRGASNSVGLGLQGEPGSSICLRGNTWLSHITTLRVSGGNNENQWRYYDLSKMNSRVIDGYQAQASRKLPEAATRQVELEISLYWVLLLGDEQLRK
ncbi:hypothetical protein NDU88_000694 [Pleurodeles waltl]|uniref:Uncharacterized protein n=1 Tax=Pleurodeles waltl TaxID=8319 RepID=A0AAV7LVK9_PLEWA|nr:hypothetical protein NDU88_000694 [Pleurodeles waltl]